MPTIGFALTLDVDTPAMRQALDSLCALVSADAGIELEPVVAKTPAALARAITDREACFAWLSPTLLLMVPGLERAMPLLSTVREGVAVFHSVVFAAREGGLETLADLKGVRAAWVAPTSAAGYLVPRLTLSRLGVDLASAIAEEAFHDTHLEVSRAVLAGRAAIGATFAHFERGDATRRLLRAGYHEADRSAEPRLLAVSGPIPSDMIVAYGSVPPAARIAVAGALCRLVHDPLGSEPFREVIGAEDFRAVTSESLAELQRLTDAAAAVG